jgi:Sec-independent protein secretion pathway component TatC
MSSILSIVKTSVTKLHFIAGLVMFLFIAFIVVENDMAKRALLLLPVVIFYSLSKVLFSMDQAEMVKDILERQKKR